MTIETKALRYVDIRCEELRKESNIEYDKFDKYNMMIAYKDGIRDICKEIIKIADKESIIDHVKGILSELE